MKKWDLELPSLSSFVTWDDHTAGVTPKIGVISSKEKR